MRKRMFIIPLALIATVALVSCGGGKGQVKDGGKASGKGGCELCGEATGYAAIFDDDKALARDRAIDDAMKKLVSSKLGSFVSGHSVVEDFALVASIVEAKSEGMVRNWKVTKEGAQEGAFVVTIYGEVYPAAVNKTIEDTLRNYGRPKFMVLIRETFEGRMNEPGFTVTELKMMEIMGDSGFEFVDAATTQQLIRRDRGKVMQAMAGNVKGNVQDFLMDDAGAEVIIVGNARTMDQTAAIAGISANMKSKQAMIDLKAIDVYTGGIIATSTVNAPGIHIQADQASRTAIERALSKALGKVSEESGKFESGPFINTITKRFLKSATERMITMNITGLDFTDLTKFRNEVQNRVRNVRKVYPRGQAGMVAKIDIEYAGKTHDLAEELNAKASALGFDIKIKETFPNKIMLSATRLKK